MAFAELAPITLDVTTLIVDVTTILQEVRLHQGIETTDHQTRLTGKFTFGTQDFGNGIVLNTTKEIGSEHQYTTTSDLFSVEVPGMESEYAKVSTRIFFKTSWAVYLFYEMAPNGNILDTAIGMFRDRNRLGRDEYYYQQCRALFNAYQPTQTSQILRINLLDPEDATTAQERNNIHISNAQTIANAQESIIDEASRYTNTLTDTATTYTKINRTGLYSIFNKGVANEAKYFGDQNMRHPNQGISQVEDTIFLPELDVTNVNVGSNERLICQINGESKHALIFGRNWTRGWENPSTGFYTEWAHHSHGINTFRNIFSKTLIAVYPNARNRNAVVLREQRAKETEAYLKKLNKGENIGKLQGGVEVGVVETDNKEITSL